MGTNKFQRELNARKSSFNLPKEVLEDTENNYLFSAFYALMENAFLNKTISVE
jgi:hypothetical protein